MIKYSRDKTSHIRNSYENVTPATEVFVFTSGTPKLDRYMERNGARTIKKAIEGN